MTRRDDDALMHFNYGIYRKSKYIENPEVSGKNLLQ
jgi:hypothetical protein